MPALKHHTAAVAAAAALSATSLGPAAARADDIGVYLGGSLGAAQQNYDADVFDAHGSATRRTGANLVYGAGAGTHWGSFGARLEYERYEVSHSNDMAMASIGLTWAFL